MKLRTNKQGTLIATVDGTDHEICAKGEHDIASVQQMCAKLMELAKRDEVINEAMKALEAARRGEAPELDAFDPAVADNTSEDTPAQF